MERKYSELKHEFDQKEGDLKLAKSLMASRSDDIKKEIMRLRSQPTIQPNIGRKPQELDFNSVYRQLNHEQKQAYQSIKSVLEQKLAVQN